MPSKVALTLSGVSLALALTLAGCGGTPTTSPTTDASAAPSTSAPSAAPSAGEASASPSAAPTAHPSITPSTTIDGISVAGNFGGGPAVTFKAPFAIDQTRSKVLHAGTGATVTEASYVDVDYVGINAYTGETFDSSWKRGSSGQFPVAQVVPGFKAGLVGKKVGDRVLIVMPGKDGYDSSGGGAGGKILVGDTLIFVVDILDIDYQTPVGTAVTPAPAANLPVVTADAKGVPSITIPSGAAAPTSAVVQPLVEGSGTRALKATDTILVRYRMWSWQTGTLLTDKYGDPDSGPLSTTLQCWKDGLVSKKLGSRVLLVCPPASGYPDGMGPTPTVAKGDTVVFVVDLMFAAPQPQG